MKITEPTTMATDYVLAALALVFAVRTWRVARQSRQKSIKFWAMTFAAMALAAIVAGTFHGFAHYLDEGARTALWKTTVYLTGLMSFSMVAATIPASLPASVHCPLLVVAALKFVLYAVWMSSHNDFRYVVYDYGSAMLVVLLLQVWAAFRSREQSAPWIIAGVLVSFAGAAVQQSGLTIHTHFNHNDLYHVIQMGAIYLFYRGGCHFRDQC